MLQKTSPWKQARLWNRVKLIYSRITLNRFTTWYFLFALLNCLVSVVLQGIAFADNSKAIHIIEAKYPSSSLGKNMCPPHMNCSSTSSEHSKRSLWQFEDLDKITGSGNNSHLALACQLFTTKFYGYHLNLEKRENIVTMVFNVWLLSLGFVTIVYESLPHLGALLVGQVLGTVWAAYNLASHGQRFQKFKSFMVNECSNSDLWSVRPSHEINIAILVSNTVALLALAFLSFKLTKLYASQSFSRIGSSPTISRIYKIVLVFSACLQLAAFFSLASASLWFDRVESVQSFFPTQNMKLYLVACIFTILLSFPWVLLGWDSVRKEGRRRFLMFSHISVFLVVVTSLKFFSSQYQVFFEIWSFFASITVISFVLIVITSVLGVWCRLNFGRGLYQYLEATVALDEIGFTPETFKNEESQERNAYRASGGQIDGKQILQMITEYIKQPQVVHESTLKSRRRGQSIYSEKVGAPLKFSSTPSLFRERDWAAAEESPGVQDHFNPRRSSGYKQRLKPLNLKNTNMASPFSRRSVDLTHSPRLSFASPMSPSGYLPPPTPSVSSSRTKSPRDSERLVKHSYTHGEAFLDMS